MKPNVKPFCTYAEQVTILQSRGMHIEDPDSAQKQLETVNYYRLSGYWHTMRQIDPDTGRSLNAFKPGSSFSLTVQLYDFDERLRTSVLADLARIELAMRALIGHHLGELDPLAYTCTDKLGAIAKQPNRTRPGRTQHEVWLQRFNKELSSSKEEFIVHHKEQYDRTVPIWVAVEIMDWGMLYYLYHMAPNKVRGAIARKCSLTAPQLDSWLRCLNILRNYAAHHARIFNRVFDIKPKLPAGTSLEAIKDRTNRAFGQLTLIRHLHQQLDLGGETRLPEVLKTFPENNMVPFDRLGAPPNWSAHPLWTQRATSQPLQQGSEHPRPTRPTPAPRTDLIS